MKSWQHRTDILEVCSVGKRSGSQYGIGKPVRQSFTVKLCRVGRDCGYDLIMDRFQSCVESETSWDCRIQREGIRGQRVGIPVWKAIWVFIQHFPISGIISRYRELEFPISGKQFLISGNDRFPDIGKWFSDIGNWFSDIGNWWIKTQMAFHIPGRRVDGWSWRSDQYNHSKLPN